MASGSAVKCQLCGCLSQNLTLYISHLRLVHSKDRSFSVKCGIEDCREVYTAFAAFSSHVYRHHRVTLGLERDVSSGTVLCSSGVDVVEDSPIMPDAENAILEVDEPRNGNICGQPDPPLLTQAAKFLLHLREGCRISEVAMTTVMEKCNQICTRVVNDVVLEIIDGLMQSNIDPHIIEDVLSNPVPNPFEGVDTIYRFEKYCIDHLNCLEPKEISYNEKRWVNQFSGTKRRKVEKEDSFYYVPLLESLANILNLEDFQAEILNPHGNMSDDLSDFCDGSLFKSHPMFNSDPNALQLVAYYDELEVVNPIGSYIKKHKLGCMFYFLANVKPRYRSTLKSIQLLAVGKYEDITKYGIDQFMLPFVEDLKTLYCDGLTISVAGQNRVFYGGLLAFLADNLAAHLVGGFKQSMSFALRICRGCMITRELSQECFTEHDCVLRTSDTHFEQCALLAGPLSDHFSTAYGINRLSILEEVPEFSVTSGLPHDIMHDLFEGVVPYHMTLLLCHCIDSKFFTIEELNERILAFDFFNKKPTKIDPKICHSGSKVKQSASQMMALSREFALLIGDKIPEDDSHWLLFLILLRICSIALAPKCSPDLIAYLSLLVEEYLCTFQEIYPEKTLIPKQHYMIHYASQIERFGPLILSWTMRQESKLSFVKRVSRSGNYKNVPQTVARRHQFWFCHQLQLNSNNILTPQLEVSPKQFSSTLSCEDCYIQRELKRIIPDLSSNSNVYHPDWVELQSSHFCKGVYVLLQYDTMNPVFGKIIDIVNVDNHVIICVNEYYGDIFCSHYNAFVLKAKGVISAYDVHSLVDHRPFYARHSFCASDKSLYITLPYYY